MKNKIVHQWEVIKRNDAYVGSANTKAGLILSVSTAAATYTLTSLSNPCENTASSYYVLVGVISVLMILCMLVSMWYSFHTIFPNTAPGSSRSLISFVHTSNFEGGAEAYFQAVSQEGDENRLKDLCYQTHTLAVIANEKFSCMKKAVNALKVGTIAGVVLLIIVSVAQLHNHLIPSDMLYRGISGELPHAQMKDKKKP